MKKYKNIRQLIKGDSIIGSWSLYTEREIVPIEYRDPEDKNNLNYEIIAAIPSDLKDESTALYSYFPTEVIIPLPIVCHTTLELTSNRKYPTEKKANAWVLKRLASFLPKIAKDYATTMITNLWVAIDPGCFPTPCTGCRVPI